MASVVSPSNSLQAFILVLVMFHLIAIATILNWPPVSLFDWMVFAFTGVYSLAWDGMLIYIFFLNKTNTKYPSPDGEKT